MFLFPFFIPIIFISAVLDCYVHAIMWPLYIIAATYTHFYITKNNIFFREAENSLGFEGYIQICGTLYVSFTITYVKATIILQIMHKMRLKSEVTHRLGCSESCCVVLNYLDVSDFIHFTEEKYLLPNLLAKNSTSMSILCMSFLSIYFHYFGENMWS